MLDRWLKAAGVEADGVAGQASQAERVFDASQWSEFDGSAEGLAPRRSSRRHGRSRRLQRLALFSLAMLFACATALLVLSADSGASSAEEQKAAAEASPGTPQKPAWLPVIRPIRLFTLEAPELIKTAQNYDAVRSTLGDGREDNLSFGSAARGDAPFMRVSVYRAGSEAVDPAPFFVDLSRRAASLGLAVAKTTPGEPMRSKFGEMETAEVKLQINEVERNCLAFRHAVTAENLRIAGWYCAPAGGFAGPAGLSCLVDRLTLLSAGEDHLLRDSFAAAERRRPATCGKGPLLSASAASAPLPQEIGPARLRGLKPR
jgi:hypothetical protein